MRPVTDLRYIWHGETVYIVGSGATMKYIPRRFFQDKLTIGMNEIFRYYPELNYYHLKHHYECLDEGQKRNIRIVTPRYSVGAINPEHDIKAKARGGNVYYYEHLNNDGNVKLPVMFSEDVNVFPSGVSGVIQAVYLAYYMGAGTAILCGVDMGRLDGNYTLSGDYPGSPPELGYELYEIQLLGLKDHLKEKMNIFSLNPFINPNLERHIYTRC